MIKSSIIKLPPTVINVSKDVSTVKNNKVEVVVSEKEGSID